MGKVVKLEPSSPGRRTRRRPEKVALVLGGGGFTGGVYEIGALRALDLLWVNRTVNQFDIYVGTSAGAFIAALCANGVTPEEMMRVVTHQGPRPSATSTSATSCAPTWASCCARARCCRCARRAWAASCSASWGRCR